MYRGNKEEIQFFIVHPGGPFFTKKDIGYWGIPKGLSKGTENHFEAALREFKEETGIDPSGPYTELGSVKLKSGKIIHAWAFEGKWEESKGISSNTFELEWPPSSGIINLYPEIDQARWVNKEEAKEKMSPPQYLFIERLENKLSK